LDHSSEPELDREGDVLPNLGKMKKFFRDSKAFEMLLNDLRMQLLPHPLREIIQTAPHESLSLSDQHDNTISNLIKACIENFTLLE
jgi:hypothetical protein